MAVSSFPLLPQERPQEGGWQPPSFPRPKRIINREIALQVALAAEEAGASRQPPGLIVRGTLDLAAKGGLDFRQQR